MTETREPIVTAEGLRLDACVAEALGVVAAADLAQRILEQLRARPAGHPRRGWLASALLVAAGILVASAVAWLQWRHRAAPAVVGQPETPQDPGADAAKLERRIGRLVRDLEIADRRGAALVELQGLGAHAVAGLRQALAAELERGRGEVLEAIEVALRQVTAAEAKRCFGLPPGEVTIVADYAANAVVMFDAEGKELRRLDGVHGVWDVELTLQGTLLMTEFALSRVHELDATGRIVWEYTQGLRSPYSAQRLPNGNTLIANTFAQEVIEVSKEKKVVWRYAEGIRPFDAERLANGNTLIADALGKRVLEVDPAGKIVWSVAKKESPHDADRLPNGNTLITLRSSNSVVEVDRDGKEVWRRDRLDAPSDADRLPNGNTLVAENGAVREFDQNGNVVWKRPMTWAVEVNRY